MMSRDFRCADDLPRVISHRRYRQRNYHKTSVFASAYSLKMGVFAAPDSLQNFSFLNQAIRRDQDCDRLADSLVGQIAEQTLCCLIPGDNHTVESFADDGITARLYDRSQMALNAFGALSLADVSQHVF